MRPSNIRKQLLEPRNFPRLTGARLCYCLGWPWLFAPTDVGIKLFGFLAPCVVLLFFLCCQALPLIGIGGFEHFAHFIEQYFVTCP